MQLEYVIWIIAIIAGLWSALIYYQRGRNPVIMIAAAFFAALLGNGLGILGWFVPFGLVILARMSGINEKEIIKRQTKAQSNVEKQLLDSGAMKKCPFCAEVIRPDALICKFCGRDLSQSPAMQPKPPANNETTNK